VNQALSEAMLRDRPDVVPFVVSNGMGVNSTAVLVQLVERGLRPQLIQFANTGDELPATYEYIPMLAAFLATHGMPETLVVKKRSKYESLYHNCLGNDRLPSLAFGHKGCSLKWKVQPMDSNCNHWAPARACWKAGHKVIKAIGYDDGDRDHDRFANSQKTGPNKKYEFWYPLIEWGLDREACKSVIRNAGLPVPPKSACFMCPARKEAEVHDMALNHSDLASMAALLEVNAKIGKHGLKSTKGLGRRWSWLERLSDADPAFAAKHQDYLEAWRQIA
jgi:hypothetical protein